MKRTVILAVALTCAISVWGRETEQVPLRADQRVTASVQAADPAAFKGAKWLWHGDAKTAKGAVSFRSQFTIPAGAAVESARLVFTCDNGARVAINGREAAFQVTDEDSWRTLKRVEGIGKFLRAGRNTATVTSWLTVVPYIVGTS